MRARKEPRKLLRPKRSRCRVNVINKPNDMQKRILNLRLVRLFGIDCLVLLDIGAVPNITANSFLTLLGVKLKSTRRTITMVSASNAKSTGLIQDMPVTFDDIKTHIEFHAVEEVSVDVLIGPTQL